jgi:hypothetical protein
MPYDKQIYLTPRSTLAMVPFIRAMRPDSSEEALNGNSTYEPIRSFLQEQFRTGQIIK